MTKQPRRGHCARCGRPASVEIVYQGRTADGVLAEPVAERLCDRHRQPKGDGLTMQVRTLAVGSAPTRSSAPAPAPAPVPAVTVTGARRRLFPGHRRPWTPLSLLADRPSGPAGGSSGPAGG
ncbi:MAG TPA: hypothetical protein VHB02_03130 [Acidimicrobiales bacterium]|nr:hypothetical protein [Acidimicrobiales bacterium]